MVSQEPDYAPKMSSRQRRITSTALALLIFAALPACVNGKGNSYSPAEREIAETLTPQLYAPRTAEQREAIETQDLFAQAAFWSREYDLNPGDLEAAIKLSSALRRMGNPQKAMDISRQARAMFPRDTDLIAELGGALVAMERGKEAIAPLSQATRLNPNNPRLWSLLGASYDQMEQYGRAREFYSKALALAPHDSNVLANVGLSYALEGNARTAEVWLRRAAQDPNASAHIRQNLALVLGLQGKYAEAENLARQDLDPDGAENNLAYLRSLKGRDRSYEAVSQPPSQTQQSRPTASATPRAAYPRQSAPQSPYQRGAPAGPAYQQRQAPNPRAAQTQPYRAAAPQYPQRTAPQARPQQTSPRYSAPAPTYRQAQQRSAQAIPQPRSQQSAAARANPNRFIPPQTHTAEQQAVLAQIAKSLSPGQSKAVPMQTQILAGQGGAAPTQPEVSVRTIPQYGQSAANNQAQPAYPGYPQQQGQAPRAATQMSRPPLRRRE